MAASQPAASLDALEQMMKEALIQTGRIVIACRKDAKGDREQTVTRSRAKILACHERFNAALDDLESDIIKAKSVLLRDLEVAKAKREAPEPEPEPVAAAPPAPMIIDLDETPIKNEPPHLTSTEGPGSEESPFLSNQPVPSAETKPMAPFPNMGIEMPSPSSHPGVKVKDEIRSPEVSVKASPRPPAPASIPAKQAAKVPQAPVAPVQAPAPAPAPVPAPAPAVPDAAMYDALDLTGTDNSGTGPQSNTELNFTDMMFSLAPSSDSQTQAQPQTQTQGQTQTPIPDQSIDLSTFGSVDTNMLSLHNNPGASSTSQAAVAPMDAAPAATEAAPPVATAPEEASKKAPEADMDDLFNLDGGSMDNYSMDMDLGGGDPGNSNFDEMFYADGPADSDMNSLGEGRFDDAFFGL
ncbi:hypothetical protein NKR23_g2802 [Pleurostoma richardsiae]|uniref:Uncharacterized protein n=1 Tax=Pleurostoma richardsiae TaxID=41990 RepID=A0AA38VUP9_9PEZI|nr:hypothetical protein NKR23_g2802 [Pleurostoma richardsiae]